MKEGTNAKLIVHFEGKLNEKVGIYIVAKFSKIFFEVDGFVSIFIHERWHQKVFGGDTNGAGRLSTR